MIYFYCAKMNVVKMTNKTELFHNALWSSTVLDWAEEPTGSFIDGECVRF